MPLHSAPLHSSSPFHRVHGQCIIFRSIGQRTAQRTTHTPGQMLQNRILPVRRLWRTSSQVMLGTYVIVAMHDEDDYNLQMTLSNPGHFTLSVPQNVHPSWDNVEGTFERGQLTGSFKGFHPPNPSPLTPELERTRQNLRRFDFHTMVPPNWYLGSVNHAIDMVAPVDNNGNHYLSVMLHYFDNPRADGVWYLGKKVILEGGQEGLTEDERVKLGIGVSFADVEARGRMEG